MYHIRQREWGTCVAWLDEEYTKKRMEGDRKHLGVYPWSEEIPSPLRNDSFPVTADG